jgi:transcriptional regulator with XRE-family HTH domain
MPNQGEAAIRKRILGVLLRHARQRANLTLRDVGDKIGSSADAIADHEYGRTDLSLAELEIFAHLYRVPVAYFWSENLPEEHVDRDLPVETVIALRRRIIAVLLQLARAEAGRGQEDLAELLDCPPKRIVAYEMAESDIPLLELETMAHYLGVSMSYFFDHGINPTGEAVPDMEELKQMARLPEDVRRFLVGPGSMPCVRLAMQLSALPASLLRRLGEGLLDITY